MGLINKTLSFLNGGEKKEDGKSPEQEGPEDLQEGRGNESAQADMSPVGLEDETSFLDAAETEEVSVASGQGGGGQATAEPPPEDAFNQLQTLLGGEEVTDAQRDQAADLLRGMSQEQRDQFIALEGGEYYTKLEAAFAKDDPNLVPEAIEQAGAEQKERSWWDITTDVAAGGWGMVSEGVSDWWNEEENSGIDLNSAQTMAGGDLFGMTLDTSGDNDMQIGGSLGDGRLDVRIPELKIAGIATSSMGVDVITGPGVISAISLSLDGATGNEKDSKVSAFVGGIGFNGINLAGAALEPTVMVMEKLTVAAVNASMTKVGEGGDLHGDLGAQVLDDLTELAYDLLAQIPMIGAQFAEGETDSDSVLSHVLSNVTGLQDYDLAIGGAQISNFATYDDKGNVTKVGEVNMGPVHLALQQKDTLETLRAEYESIKNTAKKSAMQQDRMAWMETEIPRLEAMLPEYEAMVAKLEGGAVLSAEENDRWIELEKEFTTGVASIQLAQASVTGIEKTSVGEDGEKSTDNVDDVNVSGLSVNVTSGELGALGIAGVTNAGTTRSDALNARLGIKDEPSESPLQGTSITGSLGSVGISGADTSSGDVDSARASGVDFELGGDAGRLQVDDASVQGLDAAGVSVQSGSVRDVDVSAIGDDVGGYVGGVDATGVAYNDGKQAVDVASADVDGVRFDGNVRLNDDMSVDDAMLRSASVEGGSVEGLGYESGDTKVSLDSASVTDASVRGASMSGGSAQSVALGSGQAEGLRYEDGSQTVSLDSGSVSDLAASEVSANGAGSLDVASADVTGAGYQADGVEASLASGSVRDLSATDLSTSGVGSATVAEGSVTDADVTTHDADGNMMHVSVDQGSAEDITAADVVVGKDDATGSFGVGNGQATGIEYGSVAVDEETGERTAMTATVDSAGLTGLEATRTEDGTTVGLDSATASGIDYSDNQGTDSASVREVSVGRVDAELDGNDELVSADIAGLKTSDLDVQLSKLAMDERGTSEGPAPEDRFTGDALATASGTMSVTIPLQYKGINQVTLTVPVTSGIIDAASIGIAAEGSGLVNWGANKLSGVSIVEGKGLQVKAGPFTLTTAMDTREYAGMQSADAGGGRKGAIHVKHFAEGFMNGETQAELDPEVLAQMEDDSKRARRREARRDRKNPVEESPSGDPNASVQQGIDEGMAAAEAATADYGVQVGNIAVNLGGLQMGAGDVGFESAMATMDDRGVEDFNLSFTLGQDMGASASHIGVEKLRTDSGVDMEGLGIDGLDVTVAKALSRDRTVTLGIDDLQVDSIHIDGAELKGEG